jgi:hypothetical protein
MEHGVPEDRIIFINLVRALSFYYLHSIFRDDRFGGAQVSAPEGLKTFTARYPSLKVVGFPFSKFTLSWYHWAILFRLLGGLTRVSTSELILSLDLVTLASGGTAMPGMDIGNTLTSFQVLCMICRLGVFAHLASWFAMDYKNTWLIWCITSSLRFTAGFASSSQ